MRTTPTAIVKVLIGQGITINGMPTDHITLVFIFDKTFWVSFPNRGDWNNSTDGSKTESGTASEMFAIETWLRMNKERFQNQMVNIFSDSQVASGSQDIVKYNDKAYELANVGFKSDRRKSQL